jgi:exonuclease VII small subunit
LNESPEWPTLEDRIKNKLNSTEEAIRQLKNAVEISPVAQEILDRAEKKHE